jgi:hypothetical protein
MATLTQKIMAGGFLAAGTYGAYKAEKSGMGHGVAAGSFGAGALGAIGSVTGFGKNNLGMLRASAMGGTLMAAGATAAVGGYAAYRAQKAGNTFGAGAIGVTTALGAGLVASKGFKQAGQVMVKGAARIMNKENFRLAQSAARKAGALRNAVCCFWCCRRRWSSLWHDR